MTQTLKDQLSRNRWVTATWEEESPRHSPHISTCPRLACLNAHPFRTWLIITTATRPFFFAPHLKFSFYNLHLVIGLVINQTPPAQWSSRMIPALYVYTSQSPTIHTHSNKISGVIIRTTRVQEVPGVSFTICLEFESQVLLKGLICDLVKSRLSPLLSFFCRCRYEVRMGCMWVLLFLFALLLPFF